MLNQNKKYRIMKKETKKVTKKTVKKVEPKFIVDLTDIDDPRDVWVRFGLAKQNAGLPMTKTEFEAIIDKVADIATELVYCKMILASTPIEINGDDKLVFDSKGKFHVKKPNIFKRFWNWITRK